MNTVDYMPPEQALGGEVTPRADLYSLGAMLYEMVTGRPPFLGDDAVAIIGQHIHTPPVAPTWHNGQCPRPLEALILRLLSKDPAQRPESATDVLAALEGIDLADVGALLAAPGQDQSRALESLAGGVFVGRQREMGELKAALEEALSGKGRLAMLVGEPGIGKTRTAQELATYAGLRQCQVLWGRCYEGQGAPPYWPWVQAIRGYVRDHEDADLRSQMGSGAADIAEIVSDVKERLPDLKPPQQLEPEQARFRLFDSIASFLKGASRKQPLVVVLDDLHWADKPSLALLQFVARELGNGRVLLLGTYRDMELSRQHPLAETLGDLTKERLFQRILLRGLSQEDVARFIEMTTGSTPPQGLALAVYTHTEGNPLFVTEVVRLLVQEGQLAASVRGESAQVPTKAPTSPLMGIGDAWTVRIPEGVREVIGRRLNRLSQRCNQTLTTAAVIGREFSLEQLKPLVDDTTEDRLLEVLEEALAARVIEELPRSVGRYQFSHALIQETLAGELSTTRKVRLHARIAAELEKLYGPLAEAHAAELAHHFAEAESVLGAEKLVRYSLLAGEKALASYAWEEAEAHFQRGLAAKGVPLNGTEPATDAVAAALLFGLGRARAANLQRHQLQEAVDILSRAFDYYEAAGDVARAVAVAEYPLVSIPRGRTGVAEFIPRALKLAPSDSLAAGRLLATLGVELGRIDNDYPGAQQAFSQALTIADREKDLALQVRTLTASAEVDVFHLHFQDALEKAAQAIQLARGLDDPQAAWYAHLDACRALWFMGESVASQRHASAALELAERLRDRSRLAVTCRVNTSLYHQLGDWPQARYLSDRGLGAAPQDTTLLGIRVLLEYELGEFDRGGPYLERFLDTIPRLAANRPGAQYLYPALIIPLVARIAGVLDRLDVAVAAGQTLLSSRFSNPLYVLPSRAGLGLVAVLRGDVVAAAEQYQALAPQRSLMLQEISSDHVLGLLAQTMGNLDKAAEHFEDALAFCRKAGYRPALAWSLCDYADCLLAPSTGSGRAAPENRQKAMSLLDQALAISSELGMKPLMQRVLSRREILKA